MSTATTRQADATESAREFPFSDADFKWLCNAIKQESGISLSEAKRELVYGRVSRRIRALGLSGFAQYRELLATGDPQELVEFINALTTNLTSFFRESHHFEYLKSQFLLPRAADARASRRIRIWSSACSTGEEPYSIAIAVCEALPEWRKWDIRILATDLDSDVLARASAGVYSAERLSGMAPRRIATYFQERRQGKEVSYKVAPEVAGMISFKQLNLMRPMPMSGPLDVIFCRNVVIYFDKDTQRDLFGRMSKLQRPGDLLMLGHSENLFKVCDDYTLIGKTIYRHN
jgi:chemotaxis protein methyltransferase CheR